VNRNFFQHKILNRYPRKQVVVMNSKNELSLCSIVVFSSLSMLLVTALLGASTFLVYDVHASVISQNDSTTTSGNNTFSHDPESTVAAMVTAFGEPFYELTDAIDTGKEVVSIDPQQTKDSYIAQGNMIGIGNVTEYGTYISTYSSPSISSTGKGMIVQGDSVATFTAADTGEYDNNGNLLLKGSMYFSSESKEMESIDGNVGLYLYWKGNNGTDWTKTWLWK
jgi:hypothetical protein